MRIIILLILINTSCINSQKKKSFVKDDKDQEVIINKQEIVNNKTNKNLENSKKEPKNIVNPDCEIDVNYITDVSYLKNKLDDLNNEQSNCLETFFSYSKDIFNKKEIKFQEKYLDAVGYIYDNSNSFSSTLIEDSFFKNIFYHNINVVSSYLFKNKKSSLNKALKTGISYEYSIFEREERELKYKALHDKVFNDVINTSHKVFIINLLNDIDKELYD
ncbi:hypothetical protein [Tenacibaculum amylolyticum]|uniref:hypothetical protein n=1 Tax=Tenacibaculum amylolyticum TaxID=104269 RepID=UPI0038947E4F